MEKNIKDDKDIINIFRFGFREHFLPKFDEKNNRSTQKRNIFAGDKTGL